jgi:uncharacterized protein YpmB
MKKRDDVADDEDDDMVRTSVSQDQVTATLFTEELFLKTLHLALATYQTGQIWEWGGYGRHDAFSNTSWVSHLLAELPCNLQGF